MCVLSSEREIIIIVIVFIRYHIKKNNNKVYHNINIFTSEIRSLACQAVNTLSK